MITPIFWRNYGSDLLDDLQKTNRDLEIQVRPCLFPHIPAHLQFFSNGGKKIPSQLMPVTVAW